jgi:hypothetical protein
MAGCTEAFYPSQWDALLALSGTRMRAITRGGDPPTGACWCEDCHGWHLTATAVVQAAPADRAKRSTVEQVC